MTAYDTRTELYNLHYYEHQLLDSVSFNELVRTWHDALETLCNESQHSYCYKAFIHNRINRAYNEAIPRFFTGADVNGLILKMWTYPRYI